MSDIDRIAQRWMDQCQDHEERMLRLEVKYQDMKMKANLVHNLFTLGRVSTHEYMLFLADPDGNYMPKINDPLKIK